MVNQCTEVINALRAYSYEFGDIAPQGIRHLRRLSEIVEDDNMELPDLVRDICRGLPDQIAQMIGRLEALKKTINVLSREGLRGSLMSSPNGFGPDPRITIHGPRHANGCTLKAWTQVRTRTHAMNFEVSLAKRLASTQVQARQTSLEDTQNLSRPATSPARSKSGFFTGDEITHQELQTALRD
ncbi:hypothetical protein Q2941_47020 [Bradyrhizobium sp. UFLA05-153]